MGSPLWTLSLRNAHMYVLPKARAVLHQVCTIKTLLTHRFSNARLSSLRTTEVRCNIGAGSKQWEATLASFHPWKPHMQWTGTYPSHSPQTESLAVCWWVWETVEEYGYNVSISMASAVYNTTYLSLNKCPSLLSPERNGRVLTMHAITSNLSKRWRHI